MRAILSLLRTNSCRSLFVLARSLSLCERRRPCRMHPVSILEISMCARVFATSLCLCVLCGALNSLAGDAQNQPRVYRDRIEPHWSADGKRFWYRNELRGGKREFILVDAENGTRSTAFDAERVAAALIKLGEQGVTAEKLGIESLRFDTDPAVLVLQSKTNAWRLDLKTYSLAPDKPQAQNQASLAPSDRPRPSRRTGDSTTLNFINRT